MKLFVMAGLTVALITGLALAGTPAEKAADDWIKDLKDANYYTRHQAIKQVAKLAAQEPKLVSPIVAALKDTLQDDKDSVLQAKAAEILWSLKQGCRWPEPKEELPVLLKLLSKESAGKDCYARDEAARVLGNSFGSSRFGKEVIPALVASLEIPSRAFGRCVPRREIPSPAVIEALRQQGKAAIPHLEKALAAPDANEFVKEGAAKAIRQIKAPRTIKDETN